MTEYAKIIKELKKGKGLTCREAIDRGISINLRSRIPEMIGKHNIITTMEPHQTENGTRFHARYWLINAQV